VQFTNPYWSDKTKIELLQKWLIVHSIIYYELDSNLIDDSMYDANAKQLYKMQKQCQEAASESKWWYVFKGFQGSGFDLYRKLKREHKLVLMQQAKYVLNLKWE
jgi:NAD-dependent DNA ligase